MRESESVFERERGERYVCCVLERGRDNVGCVSEMVLTVMVFKWSHTFHSKRLRVVNRELVDHVSHGGTHSIKPG